jgi:5-methylcytosine-specific restriction protein A
MGNAKRPTGIKNLRPSVGLLASSVKALAEVPEDPEAWRAGLTTAERGYGYRWQQERGRYLRLNPLCIMCNERGIVRASTVVDHKIAHRGDQALFWDLENWQALCKPCHDSHAQRRDNAFNRGNRPP